jgi:xanthine dehydrogenase YagT iron-sulfur-binding subunit
MPKTRLNINGVKHDVELEPNVTLLDALRERLGLVGTKKGCDFGQCGACTVLVNGRRVLACLSLAMMHTDDEITTIEGVASNGTLHPLQSAFVEHDAFQCGFCTSGQIVSALGLIAEGHAKTDDEIREAMSGNLCRCGAYTNILAAVREGVLRAGV